MYCQVAADAGKSRTKTAQPELFRKVVIDGISAAMQRLSRSVAAGILEHKRELAIGEFASALRGRVFALERHVFNRNIKDISY